MAGKGGEGLDPKAFKSWEDAFKHPIPATRRFQQQLKSDISSNRERLRSLVGGSYRDLLGTADAIIEMDNQMKEVEVHLGNTSRQCNTDRLSRSVRTASKATARRNALDADLCSRMSQLAVLRACPDVIMRILRRPNSMLLAAKVLVIARRLYRALNDRISLADFVEKLWLRLTSLRQKLLRRINRRLILPQTSEPSLIDALGAYALATSSASATDLLRHFHRTRLDALSAAVPALRGHDIILTNLRLWIRTLQDTRTMFPKVLGTALARLKAEPIVRDPAVQAIDEFNLEVHERWLGDDLRNFTPYLRHDDLAITSAAQQLSEWAPAALQALLATLSQALGTIDDFKEVVNLQQSCLELLFSHYHIAGVRKNVVLSGFRDAFRIRLRQLVEQRCNGLAAVADTVQTTLRLEGSQDALSLPKNLWSEISTQSDSILEAAPFMATVHDAFHGFTPGMRAVTEQYAAWRQDVEAIDEIIAQLRGIKWEEHLDLDSDSDSNEVDVLAAQSNAKQIHALLRETDPNTLQSALATHLSAAMRSFAATLATLAPASPSASTSPPQSSTPILQEASTGQISRPVQPQSQSQAAFLLRIVREITHGLPAHCSLEDFTVEFPATAQLHDILVRSTVQNVVAAHAAAIERYLRRETPAAIALWDNGMPPLPTLPSQWIFQLLQDLEEKLAAVGTDLLTPNVVRVLKGIMAGDLVGVFARVLRAGEGDAGDNSAQADTGEAIDEALDKLAKSKPSEHRPERRQSKKSKGGSNKKGGKAEERDQPTAATNDADGDAKATEAVADPRGASTIFVLSATSATQFLFDLAYLACMDASYGASSEAMEPEKSGESSVHSVDESTSGLPPVCSAVMGIHHAAAEHANLDSVATGQRLGTAARAYRQRTALLFAVTNGSNG